MLDLTVEQPLGALETALVKANAELKAAAEEARNASKTEYACRKAVSEIQRAMDVRLATLKKESEYSTHWNEQRRSGGSC